MGQEPPASRIANLLPPQQPNPPSQPQQQSQQPTPTLPAPTPSTGSAPGGGAMPAPAQPVTGSTPQTSGTGAAAPGSNKQAGVIGEYNIS